MDTETHLAKTAELKRLHFQDMAELKEKAVDIKGKDYILVKDRVLFFNAQYPEGSLTTELLSAPDANMVVFKATVSPDGKRFYTGHSQAVWGDFGVNKTAALENAETSAVGRALGMMGIGVLDSIASADEMHKANGRGKGDLSAEDYESNFLDPEHHIPDKKSNALEEACKQNGHSFMAQQEFLHSLGYSNWTNVLNKDWQKAWGWASKPSTNVPKTAQEAVAQLQRSVDMAKASKAVKTAGKCQECGGKMWPSKFKEGDFYCGNKGCPTRQKGYKKPNGEGAIETGQLTDEDIPF